MELKQGNKLESIRAVQRFLDLHADRLGELNKTGVRQQLDQVVADVTGHSTSQTDHTLSGQGATRKVRELRRVLVADHMRPIARIATADLPPTPEVQPLGMPIGRSSVARIIAAARGMATAAERFAPVFTSAGLPADFVAQLTAATNALETARDGQLSAQSSRSGSTNVLGATLDRGRRIVRVLDSLVAKALNGDAELLAAWKSAKRIRRSPRTTTVKPTPGSATPSATSPTTLTPADAVSATPADAVSATPADAVSASPANSVSPHATGAAAPPTAIPEPATVA